LPGFEAYSHFQPLFLYESLLNLLGFGLLIYVARKYGKRLLPGEVFIGYVVYYAIVRFILEGYKINVWKLAGFPTARWIALLTIAACIVVTVLRRLHASRRAAVS
jgi:phosphatidylglycerol:prolipoprotein diacylglycerol transferase